MKRELQSLAWNCLPIEFKDEVKTTYREYTEFIAAKAEPAYRRTGYIVAQTELELLFGIHNLTSDAEGEEMLCVPRKKVQEIFQRNSKRIGECCPTCDNDEILKCDSRCGLLLNLFDSKCLPDENFSNVGKLEENGEVQRKYKYKVGQKVILHSYGREVSTITDSFDDGGVWLKYKVKALPNHVWNENELEPYIEPQEESKPVTDCNDVDRLIKDYFRDMRRLNIAKDFAAVLLGRLNYDPFTAQINCCCSNGEVVNPYSNIAGIALSVADALIAEYEKGDATSTTPLPAKPKRRNNEMPQAQIQGQDSRDVRIVAMPQRNSFGQ